MVNNFGSRYLKPGNNGEDVKVLQYLLNNLPVSITGSDLLTDGEFGSKTQAAIKRFQRYFGLTHEKIVGKETFLFFGQPSYYTPGPVFGSRTLKIGDSGQDVWILQNRLASTSKKYALALKGPADYSFGPATDAAVKAFQLDYGLPVTGMVDGQTFYTLFIRTFMGGRLLQRSRRDRSQGYDVYFLQKKLKDLGFNPGRLNGKFGGKTETAVKKLQDSSGIAADGIVKPITFCY